MAEHRLLYEIGEQPQIIRHLASQANDQAVVASADLIRQTRENQGRIFLAGSGSSYNACVYGQFIFSRRASLMTHLENCGEFTNFIDNIDAKDLVILVSQSGESGDALKLIPEIKTNNSKLIVITNYLESTLAKAANVALPLQAGECLAIPNTKGYTAAMTLFALLADALGGSDDFKRKANYIASDIERIIGVEYGRLVSIADHLNSAKNIFLLGHSAGLANSYEGALKLKECSRTEAEGYSALEFRHGPSSIVTQGTPIIVFMADYESETDLSGLLDEIGQPDPYIIGIGSIGHKQFDDTFEIYEHDLFAAIPAIVPIQILAYELALSRGVDPDSPEGVQRVVK